MPSTPSLFLALTSAPVGSTVVTIAAGGFTVVKLIRS